MSTRVGSVGWRPDCVNPIVMGCGRGAASRSQAWSCRVGPWARPWHAVADHNGQRFASASAGAPSGTWVEGLAGSNRVQNRGHREMRPIQRTSSSADNQTFVSVAPKREATRMSVPEIEASPT